MFLIGSTYFLLIIRGEKRRKENKSYFAVGFFPSSFSLPLLFFCTDSESDKSRDYFVLIIDMTDGFENWLRYYRGYWSTIHLAIEVHDAEKKSSVSERNNLWP